MTRILKRGIRAALAVMFAGCAVLGLDDDLADEIRDRRDAWLELGIETYDYEARVGCFCPPDLTRAHRVSVVDGVVVAATAVEDGASADPAWFLAIDELYVRMLRRLNDGAEVTVTFDPERHHPISITSFIPDAADSGWSYDVRDLRIGTGED